MKLTQKIIDDLQVAMQHTKKDGTVNWKDSDEIEVQLAGTFAADKFIVIKNKSKCVCDSSGISRADQEAMGCFAK